ncbi:MAG: hypothetical protein AB7N71_05950 [Phycisphaerae bacterium]
MIEPVSRGCVHACTIDDIVRLLELMPGEDSRGFAQCVLRQPTRKQEILRPCWGRLLYWADGEVDRGPTIFLEAQSPSRVLRWETSLDPDEALELERLRVDGHSIDQTKREWVISSTIESIRATQLYRTIPHEMGHYVQFQRAQEFVKSHAERERFAHQYADKIRKMLINRGRIPFPRQLGKLETGFEGLPKEWFGL